MTYAIIETGGKQLRVEPGRFYDIELLHVEPDQTVTLEAVLLVQHNGGVTIGQPFVEGATVEGTVMRQLRGRKVIVYKMRPKKKTRKKRGHRQEITRLMVDSISLNGSVLASKTDTTDEAQVDVTSPVEVDAEAIAVPAEVVPETADAEAEAVPAEVVPEIADAEAVEVTTDEVASDEVTPDTDESAIEAVENTAETEDQSQ